MTYDMAGSAAVVGLMKSLAIKAKINAVGVVGLVENMVSGNAQRPGDINGKSYGGKTIEILNTDAEGRLVLLDINFTEKFKPKFVVDLATCWSYNCLLGFRICRSLL